MELRWTPPSLSALRAFEAAARHLNFTRAAEDLAQTQGAISHQIRDLEARLGEKLFERQKRSLSLTEAGARYLPFVREALQQLRSGEEALKGSGGHSVLTVTLSPNFAAKWLMPRLSRFTETHPDLELRLSASMRHIDFSQDDIDVGIRHGVGDWPHLSVTKLCSEMLFPVCSPGLLERCKLPQEPADLLAMGLVHEGDRSRWRQWLAAFDVSPDELQGPTINQTGLAIDAALGGQGVALARSALVGADLLNGRLVRPIEHEQPALFAYWIVCPKEKAELPKIRRFRDWLLAEVEAEASALKAAEKRRAQPQATGAWIHD